MDRRVAAASYVGAALIGLAASWLVCYLLVPIVPKGPSGAQPAAPFIFTGALLVVYAALGAMFALAFPKRSWARLGLCLGGSSFGLYVLCWWLGDRAPLLLTDVLLLATPMIAACIGAYAGAWPRHRGDLNDDLGEGWKALKPNNSVEA